LNIWHIGQNTTRGYVCDTLTEITTDIQFDHLRGTPDMGYTVAKLYFFFFCKLF